MRLRVTVPGDGGGDTVKVGVLLLPVFVVLETHE
jgi:hypothetical protein